MQGHGPPRDAPLGALWPARSGSLVQRRFALPPRTQFVHGRGGAAERWLQQCSLGHGRGGPRRPGCSDRGAQYFLSLLLSLLHVFCIGAFVLHYCDVTLPFQEILTIARIVGSGGRMLDAQGPSTDRGDLLLSLQVVLVSILVSVLVLVLVLVLYSLNIGLSLGLSLSISLSAGKRREL